MFVSILIKIETNRQRSFDLVAPFSVWIQFRAKLPRNEIRCQLPPSYNSPHTQTLDHLWDFGKTSSDFRAKCGKINCGGKEIQKEEKKIFWEQEQEWQECSSLSSSAEALKLADLLMMKQKDLGQLCKQEREICSPKNVSKTLLLTFTFPYIVGPKNITCHCFFVCLLSDILGTRVRNPRA